MEENARFLRGCAVGFADDILRAIRAAADWATLRGVVRAFSDELGFRYFALITHEDLRTPGSGTVDLLDYAEGAVRRIVGECGYRRDPIMRAALFADCAFLWSELRRFITVDSRDRLALELGRREGLDQGITVPCGKLGHSLGSCTFAGLRPARHAEPMLGPAQMFGTFAFQRARSLAGSRFDPAPAPRLEPRFHDCVVLVGHGLKNKTIAHRLGIAEHTVETYIRDARRLLGARDRTELVAAALLAGEIMLHELRPGPTVRIFGR
jgi:DNA-binding CsgD family transcriptional regulator